MAPDPLLFEAELLQIAPGDLVRCHWFPGGGVTGVGVEEPYRSAGGVLQIPIRARNGLTTPMWSLPGPSSSGSAYYGTRRSQVVFQKREAA